MPFSVTGPTDIALDASRTGRASFVVTNVTGRPVNVRLLPQPLDGAQPGWLSVTGGAERPLGTAETQTVEVLVQVPPDTPAGTHALRLDAALEDRPEILTTGQSVSFTVPAPGKKKTPWWVWLIVAAVIVLLGGGALIWYLTRSQPLEPATATKATELFKIVQPETPEPSPDPTAEPELVAVDSLVVGEQVMAVPGEWDLPVVVQLVWEACPASATNANPTGCEPIAPIVDGKPTPPEGDTYAPVSDQAGMLIRVVEHVLRIDPDDPDAAIDEPVIATQASDLVGPVQALPEIPMVDIPDVIGLDYSAATAILQESALAYGAESTGTQADCAPEPKVENQYPPAGESVEEGSTVRLYSKSLPGKCYVIGPIFEFPYLPWLDLDVNGG